MVSKNQIKRITALQQKKFRTEHELFIAEGFKVIQELFQSHYEIQEFYSTDATLQLNNKVRTEIISEADLKKISCLKTPNTCLAVFRIPEKKAIIDSGLIVALDDVRDPGNLGTILRLCDWFGIQQLICSNETVDIYNPKVVQATMGSISRVNVTYVDLNQYLAETKLAVFGTFMDGENIYRANLPQEGIVVMGNEANGISSAIEKNVDYRLTIPRFGILQKTESLNVATATAIILSEFKRNS